MFNGFWGEYSILLIAAMVGNIAILPYGLRIAAESKKAKSTKLSRRTLLLLSIIQSTILFAIVTGLGLLISSQIGLGAPLIKSLLIGTGTNNVLSTLVIPVILGIIGGAMLLVLDLTFLPYLPDTLLKMSLKTTQWENLLASFYGGINEELLMRLFGVSLIAWLLAKVWHTNTHLPTTLDMYIAIFIMSLIFALGHLPALTSLVGKISKMLLARTLILNGAIGLICGWVFWQYGIEASIITHFTADIVYHVGGTYVLRWKFTKKQ